ncbi:GDSL-type esterase/lipase family protein [Flavihumibacter profundi]|uniref:GDSL-type esterase/lipase family protein n=1 Tax=Flavihumibacter profundi TaxID=2716883 RepID=UPI001CC51482|nr:GDSL-type esterase/lipase family protein [Flavihumibacter profundi]MBZ5858789.1 GDSL-type esterase/lipase family protein [Flavihumibacter profundi]
MRKIFIVTFTLLCFHGWSQPEVIKLYQGKAPGSESWNWEEKRMDVNMFNTPVVYDVVEPTLTVVKPAGTNTGTAVIIAPGGGFRVLSINSEGMDVANWLSKKGVTAFVLKYRLVHAKTSNPPQEMMDGIREGKKFEEENAPVIAMALNDGLQAVDYVRKNAANYGVDPHRIGFMGFSAGGTVTMSVVFNANDNNRPDFIAPVYAYTAAAIGNKVPTAKTPAFIVAASNDQFGLAPSSVDIYNKWLAAGQPAELHMYEKGGHGFGMRVQDIPTDSWIERFGDWLGEKGLLWPVNPMGWMATTNYQQSKKWEVEGEKRFHNDWANLARFADENKAVAKMPLAKNRVVFMGNSITEGWKSTDSAFFAGRQYINRGISGQTTPQMVLRFRPDVIDLKPKVVVILAGINDIAGNTGPMTLEETFGNIVSMATLAKANKIKVIISSVLPAYDFPWRPGMEPAPKVIALNKMLKEYAAKNGCGYVDYFSAMADGRNGLPVSLAGDGIHPNLAGYKIMEPLVEKEIAKALKD